MKTPIDQEKIYGENIQIYKLDFRFTLALS